MGGDNYGIQQNLFISITDTLRPRVFGCTKRISSCRGQNGWSQNVLSLLHRFPFQESLMRGSTAMYSTYVGKFWIGKNWGIWQTASHLQNFYLHYQLTEILQLFIDVALP